MSFHIESHGKKHIDFVLHKEKISNVRKYSTAGGKIATKMGIAAKVLGDDGKTYYVNLKDIGRVWNRLHTNPTHSKSKLSQGKVDGITSKIDHYFQERAQNKQSGVDFIKNAVQERKTLDEKVKLVKEAIKEAEPIYFNENCELIRNPLGDPKEWSASNLNILYFELKNRLQIHDKKSNTHSDIYAAIFPENITDYGIREVLDSVYKQFSPEVNQ